VGIIGGMLLYVVLDFLRQTRKVRTGPQVPRMTPNAVAQHTLLAVSFVLLVVTGFALRYSERWPFHVLFGWDGGSRVRGIAHRTAAVIFVIGCLWHLAFLRTAEGRRFLRDMLPRPRDLSHLVKMLAHNLGRSADRPHFGRFGYVEKAEYWALIWGSVVMFVTGTCLWFDNELVRWIPKGFLEVMLIIHFYEAVLATLAIAVWHMYSTVLSPSVYPGNPAWLTGTMPEEMHRHEHAAEETPGAESPARREPGRADADPLRRRPGEAPQESI
jgi:cytochrome b subunit of formate dehydrogenase